MTMEKYNHADELYREILKYKTQASIIESVKTSCYQIILSCSSGSGGHDYLIRDDVESIIQAIMVFYIKRIDELTIKFESL